MGIHRLRARSIRIDGHMFTPNTTAASQEPIDSSIDSSIDHSDIELEPNQHVARIRALLARGEYVVDLDELAMSIVATNARRTQS